MMLITCNQNNYTAISDENCKNTKTKLVTCCTTLQNVNIFIFNISYSFISYITI